MRTFAEVADWMAGAAARYSDPAEPVCQLFFRWQDNLEAYRGEELACGVVNGELVLVLNPVLPQLPLPVQLGEPTIRDGVELEVYGAELVTTGVWSIVPSLNVEQLIHGFVVLHGVPDPAPWGGETRILLP